MSLQIKLNNGYIIIQVMFKHAVKHFKMPARYDIRNEAGMTPLQLSYKLGRVELFSSLLDLTSETQWLYRDLAYVAYPLPMLDSIGPDGEPSKIRTTLSPFTLSY